MQSSFKKSISIFLTLLALMLTQVTPASATPVCTVGPITEAIAEEFGRETKQRVRVSVGISGTGGGFEKFCKGETDISDASRAIKDTEKAACAGAGVEFIELKIGIDA